MKIVCESCGAKYSIADDKVAGKVFRIRCKKCSASIVVRADGAVSTSIQPAATNEAIAAANPAAIGAEGIWYAVVDGNQQGPYSPEQILELYFQKKVAWESYIWREGMDGWKHMHEVPELVALIPADSTKESFIDDSNEDQTSVGSMPSDVWDQVNQQPQAAASPLRASATGAALSASNTGKLREAAVAQRMSQTDEGADLFGQDDQTKVADSSAQLAQAFGTKPLAASGTGSAPLAASGSSSGSTRGEHPSFQASSPKAAFKTGIRNENSVLFSLSNLQAAANAQNQAPSAKTGSAGQDSSGLIDIRSLANLTGTGTGARGAGNKGMDDILSLGLPSSPLAGGLGAPVLAPEPSESSSNKLVYIAIGAAVLAVMLTGVVVFMLLNKPTPVADGTATAGATTAATGATPPATTGATAAATQDTAKVGSTDAKPTTTATPKVDNEKPAEAKADAPVKAEHASSDTARDSAKTSARGGKRGGADVEAGGKNTSKSSGDESISELLDKAAGSKRGGGGGDDSADLPETPSRTQVLSALRGVQPAVTACGGGQKGVAMTTVTVEGTTGKVVNAKVASGPFASGPAAACIARAVKGAKFPKFKQNRFEINFPYAL